MKESGLKTTAKNPHSTAFGIWQGLLATRKHYAPLCGAQFDTVDYDEQLCQFRLYVKDAYGSSYKAYLHSKTTGWY